MTIHIASIAAGVRINGAPHLIARFFADYAKKCFRYC
jgi:hypothetical protein